MHEVSSGLWGQLKAAGQLQDVTGLWFNGKDFVIDGYRFINCRFDSCNLKVGSMNFEMVDCFIDEATEIALSSDCLKIVKLLNARKNKDLRAVPLPWFYPVKNPNGTITIKGE